MPVIFVHGVNTRESPSYDAGLKVKTTFFARCLQGATVGGKTFGLIGKVTFPYWGDRATTFAWNMASLPRGDMQALSAAGDMETRAILAIVRDALPGQLQDEPLFALARRNFVHAVETICALALANTPPGKDQEIAEFVVSAQAFAAANPQPPWLATTTNDQQLLGNLSQAVATHSGVQAQGFPDVLNVLSGAAIKLKAAAQAAVGTAVDRIGDFASTKLLGWTRESLNEILGRFSGDVFIYLNGRGDKAAPGPIPQAILAEIDKAIGDAPAGEPLVIVGHSLGGVITFDLLSHFRPNLPVDLFVSVGSQVAHFEEMKLYRVSDPAVKPPQKAPTPTNIKRWINVYDEVDIFAYSCKNVFERVDVDARYDTQTYVIKAHGAYFDQARFYERLRSRVDQLPA